MSGVGKPCPLGPEDLLEFRLEFRGRNREAGGVLGVGFCYWREGRGVGASASFATGEASAASGLSSL